MRRFAFLSCSLALLVLACGSRGPLDITGGPYGADASDATIDVGPDVVDAGVDMGRDAGQIVNCLSCVQQNCGSQLLMCIQSQPCRDTLQCAVQNCFSGGMGFNAQCLLQKCGQNLSGFAQVLSVVTCVTSKCGEQCISLLGGMMDVRPPPNDPE